MSRAVVFALLVGLAGLGAGCHTGSSSPEVRVLGVHQAPASHVFVQVSNPAQRPMRLEKLQYVFASSSGTTISEGEMPLSREIPAGAVTVLDIPLDGDASETLTLTGKLTAELDQMVRTFRLNAQIQPH